MAWTALSFGFASKLTSTKMTQLFNNLTAVANGDSGAPPVINAGRDFTSATLTAGSQSVAGSGSYTLPAGLWIISMDSSNGLLVLQINSSGWKSLSATVNESGAMVYSDGSNVRVDNTDVLADTFYYLRVT